LRYFLEKSYRRIQFWYGQALGTHQYTLTFDSGVGGMGFKSRANQIFHTLLAAVATLIVWALAQSRGDRHRSLVTPERVLSENNEDLIFYWIFKQKFRPKYA